jgi:hypothetical protein
MSLLKKDKDSSLPPADDNANTTNRDALIGGSPTASKRPDETGRNQPPDLRSQQQSVATEDPNKPRPDLDPRRIQAPTQEAIAPVTGVPKLGPEPIDLSMSLVLTDRNGSHTSVYTLGQILEAFRDGRTYWSVRPYDQSNPRDAQRLQADRDANDRR